MMLSLDNDTCCEYKLFIFTIALFKIIGPPEKITTENRKKIMLSQENDTYCEY